MNRIKNIFWLGIKELRSLSQDKLVIALLIWALTFSVYTMARGTSTEVHNASIAFVDEDRSDLSNKMINSFYPPSFFRPEIIEASEMDDAMDAGRYIFIVNIPPDFEADVRDGRQPTLQLNIDATAVIQAGVGASYVQNILSNEINRYASGTDQKSSYPANIVTHTAFNPNRTTAWFAAIVALIDQVTMLTVILTGAALIREREHGTLEHLLVMPLTAFDIAMSKVWANSLVLLIGVVLSLHFIVVKLLEVPIAGSVYLFLTGTVLYLFFATALGIFLGTVARSMAQFALLFIVVILVVHLLSGGMTPIESQPEWLRKLTWFLPSRHFISGSQAILFRGADFKTVWPQFAVVAGQGWIFFLISLQLFRRSIASSR
ncbi:ABC transporter permease [Verrucomicrobiaceae bacterium R5-34]|nr:ABC transporter permease [Verrucomicrobiaceae bacterium R5-34]